MNNENVKLMVSLFFEASTVGVGFTFFFSFSFQPFREMARIAVLNGYFSYEKKKKNCVEIDRKE